MTVPMPVATATSSVAKPRRIASIDILRGLTMTVMIFVNDLDDIQGLPWWTHHAKAQWNVMTYVDMVFPFFLFLVGMSLPLAIAQRLRKNPSLLSLWQHIIFRSVGLIVLGLILANAERGDPSRMHLSTAAWGLLGLLGGILFWLAPAKTNRASTPIRVLRGLGFALLVFVYAVFRHTGADGQISWINGSYPEILGLIGYAYLASAILYIPTRRWQWSPMAWFIVATAFCAFATAHHDFPLLHLPLYIWPFGNGSSVSLILAGAATSKLFFGEAQGKPLRLKNLQALAFAAAALIAGWLLTPLGISKIRATPTWCLYTIAAAAAIFTLLHYLCDVRGKRAWAGWVYPAGENTLLTYLLPDLYFYGAQLIGFTYFAHHLNAGAAGVAVVVFFTAAVLAVSALLTRLGLRLQL